MIGIYKITNPKGRVYIGQSVNIEKRKVNYGRLQNCKTQTKLYRSLVKYGFSEHIFEIVEQCIIEELNTRERYWQDFYNVLEEGLNCRLTRADGKSGRLSEETVRRRVASIDWVSLQTKRIANTDYAKRTANTDYSKRTQNTDYASFQDRKVANTDYKARAVNQYKPVLQFTKEGIFIKEWPSIKEVGETLKIHRTDITQCCKGRYKSAGGYSWKYK